MRPLRIAVVGTRGVPATYGGVERHVEEIGARMVERGHQVVVYAREGYLESPITEHRGMTIRALQTIESKHLEAFLHSGHASIDCLGRSFDIVHFHAIGPGLFSPVNRFASHAAVVQTIHGRDDQRGKWGGLAQRALRVGTWLSTWVPDQTVVVSKELQADYLQSFGRQTVHIPNGTPDPVFREPQEIKRLWGLQGNDYVLALGRLVPEKDAAGLIRAFRNVATECRLVIVGGSSHSDEYVSSLHSLAAEDPRVILTGYQYNEVLEELLTNARIFAQPSLLEGLPLTLLEAAGYRLPVLASDIGPHVEVLEGITEGAAMFRAGDQADLTRQLTHMLQVHRGDRAESLAADVRSRYSWDLATDRLLETYEAALAVRGKRRARVRRAARPALAPVRTPGTYEVDAIRASPAAVPEPAALVQVPQQRQAPHVAAELVSDGDREPESAH